jgi:hypothetical protein
MERPFGMLQSHWAIVRHPARIWSHKKMWENTTVYMIMHNIIVEEDRDENKYDQE